MNSAATLDNMIRNWKTEGHTKAELLVLQADAMLGWPYAWGASGQDCTPEKRTYFMNRSAIGAGDAELIRKRCQILNGSAALCSGCKYYPGGAKTRIQDCQGFMKEICKTVGITLKGGGCTSMWNDNSNWTEKGLIKDMPAGAVCLVFKHISSTGKMDHVGLHIGGGNIIHCSGEVKRGKTSEKGWTHYAIPKGLEGGGPVPDPGKPTLRRGSRGEYVTLLQTMLVQRGYDIGKCGADGAFGAATEAAVKMFQTDHGLPSDGIVGENTWAALESGKTELYTVTIQHVSRSVAEGIVHTYGGTMTAEGSDA